MPLSTQIQLSIQAAQTAAYDLGPNALKNAIAAVAKSLSWDSGTASGQADLMFSDTRTLTASAAENLDVAGTLTDAFGSTLTLVKLRLIWVYAAAANNVANNVQLTRPASNGVPFLMASGDGIALAPGSGFLWFDPVGVTVTPATGDLLTVTNGAGTNSVNYDVLLIGTSA